MGDYLLLSWLSTRRGLIVFILLLLMTAFSNLYRLASKRGNDTRPSVKTSDNLKSNQREASQWRRDGKQDEDRRPPNPVKSVPSH